MHAIPHPDGERLDLTDVLADLEADLRRSEHQMVTAESLGMDLIEAACDGDRRRFGHSLGVIPGRYPRIVLRTRTEMAR